jgi:hypothetical protein
VRFLENVIDDPDRADEVASESIESYASRRHFQIANNNPQRRKAMASKKNPSTMTKSELLDYCSDLEDQLDAIADIVSPDETDDDQDADDDQDDEDHDSDDNQD